MTTPVPPTHHDALTQYRLEMIEDTLKAVAENLERLSTLEMHHLETREAMSRAFDAITKIESRVHSMEMELPTLKLARGWVITGVVGCIGLFGTLLMNVIIVSH